MASCPVLAKTRLELFGGVDRRPSAIANWDRLEGAGIMNKAMVELLARRAKLEKAVKEFPADVAAAAEQASGSVAKMRAPTDPRAGRFD